MKKFIYVIIGAMSLVFLIKLEGLKTNQTIKLVNDTKVFEMNLVY